MEYTKDQTTFARDFRTPIWNGLIESRSTV